MGRKISSLASLLVSLAATVYFSANPNWAEKHPYVTSGLFAVTGITLLFGLLQFGWMQTLLGVQPIRESRDTNETPTNSGINSRDNIGSQVSAFRDTNFIGDSALKHLLTPSQEAPNAEPTKPPLLEIEHVETTKFSYNEAHGMWLESRNTGEAMVAAKVFYPFPENATDSRPSVVVSAIIRFRELSGTYTQVDSAYWVGRSTNTKSLAVGEHGLVVLGSVRNKRWITYNNRYMTAFKGRPSFRNRSGRPRGAEIIVPGSCSGIQIELSIVDKNSGHRLAFQRFSVRNDRADHLEVEMAIDSPMKAKNF